MKHLITALVVIAALFGCNKKVDVAFTSPSVSFAPEGATVEATLTSNGEWSVDAYPEWLSVSPTSGKGDATLTLTAQANESDEARAGKVSVSSKDNTSSLMVTQEANPVITYAITLNPTAIEAGDEGGTYEVTVTANCEWTANTPAEWIHCEPASGNGDGTVTVTIDPKQGDVSEREADLIFAGAENVLVPLHVTQSAPVITLINVTPSVLNYDYTGGTQQATVNSNAEWTATCDAEWVTLSVTSGNDETTLDVTVTENPTVLEARTAEVLFSTATGETASLQVRQSGAPDPHFLEVSPTWFNIGKDGGTAIINVSCDTDWTADLDCEWASLSVQSGTGNGTITLTVEPNPIASPRSIEFKVISGLLSRVLVVNQEAGDEPLVISFEPDTLFTTYNGGFEHIDLLSNTSWQLETSNGWITLITSSGNGDASFNIVVDANYGPDERTGYVNAKHNGQILATLVVVQEGKPNIFETDITELDVRPEGGEYTIHLSSNQSWSLNCDVDWIVCRPDSGLADSDILVIVEASSNPRPRTGHIKIVGSTGAMIIVTVEQHN